MLVSMCLPLSQQFNSPITAQTLANPFANVRDDPEFVEWGYGGMGSVHASAGIANDIWKGLQRSERGGALLAGSSFDSPPASTHAGAVTAGGGRGSGAHATSPIARRKMSDDVPECGMGNVMAGAGSGDDDGSGMGWVKRRRAEREAKARLEQEANELQKKEQEGRKSTDSMDASIYASTASTTTSLTVCTSAASTDLTTPTTSPLTSRSPSVTDLKLTSSESHDLRAAPPRIATDEQSQKSDTPPAQPAPASKDEHGHHVLTAVRLSPNVSSPSHKHSHSAAHGRAPSLSHALSQIGEGADQGTNQVSPLSPVDTEETTTNTDSSGEEEPSQGSHEEEEQDDVDDDDDDEAQVSRPHFHQTHINTSLRRISGERLPSEPASRKLVDMWTLRRGKRMRRPHMCVCAWSKCCWGECGAEIAKPRSSLSSMHLLCGAPTSRPPFCFYFSDKAERGC